MKPTIYRITHLWPNKQPGQGLTAQIEEQGWTICVCADCVKDGTMGQVNPIRRHSAASRARVIEVVPAPSSTVQIKPETDEPNALPSRFVSLQDYERLERGKR